MTEDYNSVEINTMWEKHTIEKGKTYMCSAGDRILWINKQENKWQVLNQKRDDLRKALTIAEESDMPENAKWETFVADKSNLLNILPALPDRPIVIKPMESFKLLPKSNIHLFIPIPLWIQLYAGQSKKKRLVYEIPAIELSSTWLGEPDSGILAYSLRLNPSSQYDKTALKAYEVLCPIKVSNDSANTLDFQRFLLNVEQLTIYSENDLLYTNEVHIRFKEENVISEVNYPPKSPAIIENAKHIAEPRNMERRGALVRSFYFFKSLTQY